MPVPQLVGRRGQMNSRERNIAMAPNGVLTSRLRYAASHSTGRVRRISCNSDLHSNMDDANIDDPNIDNANGDARSAERTGIAQELHDRLLQGFFSVSMQLNDAVDRLPADLPAKRRFIDLLQVVERVIEEGRSTVQNLRSSPEHSEPLGQAFAGVPHALGYSAIGFRVVVNGQEKELRPDQRDEIYFIGREAIINACRHSEATSIEMRIEYGRNELRISVRDNGCGIDPKDLQWGNGHWGLQGMRERAERIGARLRLWSGVARGTEVDLRVPARVAFEQEV
jgi:signal transduction histidine kinase